MKSVFGLFAIAVLFCSVATAPVNNDNEDEEIDSPSDLFGSADPRLADLKLEDVQYNVFNNNTPSDKRIDLHTKILILGPAENTLCAQKMTNAYLTSGKYTVVTVDWMKDKKENYKLCAANVKLAAQYITDYIKQNYAPGQIHIIGFGIGSHVAGFIGKNIKANGEPLARITGLNPPAVLFDADGPGARLDKTDAVFVDVVHTDVGFHGFGTSIGTVDFYPHDGKNQPGCPQKQGIYKNMVCNFRRAAILFTESITKETLAFPSADYVSLMSKEVNQKSGIVFGESCPKDAAGNYYFLTRKSAPHLADVDYNQFAENTGPAYFKNLWKLDY